MDDLPGTALSRGVKCDAAAYENFTKSLLTKITKNKIPVTGFVTARNACTELRDNLLPKLLNMWLDAGMDLANHTYSHWDLNKTEVAEYQADILKNENILKPLFENRPQKLTYFRYPMLHMGDDAVKKKQIQDFLTAHNYQNAPVTVDNQEWLFARVYVMAKNRGDSEIMKRVAETYIPYMEQMFLFFEKKSVELFGYEIPQILLIHANELNLDYFDKLAAMMKSRNYQFIALTEALEDKAYQEPETYVGSKGVSWLHRWTYSRGGAIKGEPAEPDWLNEQWEKYRNE